MCYTMCALFPISCMNICQQRNWEVYAFAMTCSNGFTHTNVSVYMSTPPKFRALAPFPHLTISIIIMAKRSLCNKIEIKLPMPHDVPAYAHIRQHAVYMYGYVQLPPCRNEIMEIAFAQRF